MLFLLLQGGFSSADWSIRRNGAQDIVTTTDISSSSSGGGGSMPAVGVHHRSLGVMMNRHHRQGDVLDNRDLCRIVSSFIIPSAVMVDTDTAAVVGELQQEQEQEEVLLDNEDDDDKDDDDCEDGDKDHNC